jgi:hypothetical protein
MGSTREEYQQNSRTSAALDADTDGQGSAGRSGNARARSAATAIRVTARAHADAIAPSVRSPAGARLLVSALDERLEAMQREINGQGATTTVGRSAAPTRRGVSQDRTCDANAFGATRIGDPMSGPRAGPAALRARVV